MNHNHMIRNDSNYHGLQISRTLKIPRFPSLAQVGDQPGFEGNIIFDRGTGEYYGHDGSTWIPFSGVAPVEPLTDTLAAGNFTGNQNISMTATPTVPPSADLNMIYGDFGHILFSNVTAPTGLRINGNAGPIGGGDGNHVYINSGPAVTSGDGGNVEISTGKAAIAGPPSSGGDFIVETERGSSGGGDGGDMLLTTGNSSGVLGDRGGNFRVNLGNGDDDGNGGSVLFAFGHAGTNAGNAGAFQVALGNSLADGAGGPVIFSTGVGGPGSGAVTAALPGPGGSYTFTSGSGGNAGAAVNPPVTFAGSGGNYTVTLGNGGNGNATVSPGRGGSYIMTCGNSGVSGAGGSPIDGGFCSILGGDGSQGSATIAGGGGGPITLVAGPGGSDGGANQGDGGDVLLVSGSVVDSGLLVGNGGNIIFTPGNGIIDGTSRRADGSCVFTGSAYTQSSLRPLLRNVPTPTTIAGLDAVINQTELFNGIRVRDSLTAASNDLLPQATEIVNLIPQAELLSGNPTFIFTIVNLDVANDITLTNNSANGSTTVVGSNVISGGTSASFWVHMEAADPNPLNNIVKLFRMT